ncbi:ATP-binding protein, partial [Streptomyces sp. NPDC057638]|uniref:ATP-binding protein n=1 Tax=Streptomyces sp. NPDC057638 TaxID=3346190 RepID=UPI00368E680F
MNDRELLERRSALEAAAYAGTSTRGGQGRWLLLHGDTGSGRTALLKEIVRRESTAGRMLRLEASAVPAESGFAFSLLRGLCPTDGRIPFDEVSPGEEQRLFHHLTQRLSDTAATRPLLLAVDDVHLADAPSLRWLGYLSHRLSGLPALLVLTACTDPTAPRPGTALLPGAGLSPATGDAVPLPPLGPVSVARLLDRQRIPHGTRALADIAGIGRPALVRAMARGSGPDGTPAPLGAEYRAAFARWLGCPSTPHRRTIALALAVALDHAARRRPAADAPRADPSPSGDGAPTPTGS